MRLALCALAVALLAAAPAHATDRVYWGNYGPSKKISFASLDGSGGGDVATTGASVDGPEGIAIDVAAGRIYWGNYNPATSSIASAQLEGGGGADLNTAGATQGEEWGLAIDPAAGKLYFPLSDNTKVSFAKLDGSGGGDLLTTGATTSSPEGIAIDPAGNRVWWGNGPSNKISYAKLDNTGDGHDLTLTGTATVVGMRGVTLDLAGGRIYWSGDTTISTAKLDGSDAHDLTITGATVDYPTGMAIDPVAGKMYWANQSGAGAIEYANLDGSGGGTLTVTGATLDYPSFPALLEKPLGAGAPQVAGGNTTGSTLTCSPGAWAPDLLGSNLYRVPRSFSYQWSRDGAALAGATNAFVTADTPGAYRCTVTGTNAAGSAEQQSDAFAVSTPPSPVVVPLSVAALPAFGPKTLVTLSVVRKGLTRRGPIKVKVANGNAFVVTGSLRAVTTGKVVKHRRVSLRTKSFRLAAHGRTTVSLAMPKALRHLRLAKGKLGLRIIAKVRDPAGHTRTVTKTLHL